MWRSTAIVAYCLALQFVPIRVVGAFSYQQAATTTEPRCFTELSYRAEQDEESTPPILDDDDGVPLSPLLHPLEEEDDDDEDDFVANSVSSFSHSRWKKKRYIMMKDVDEWIDKDPVKAVKKAEELIRRMEKLYAHTGVEEYRPTTQAYNLWIHALAKSRIPQAGQQAESVLEQMKLSSVTPNAVSYTSIIDAHAKSRQRHAARQAERVLMEFLDEEAEIHISAVDATLNALALSSSLEAAERANMIVERLEKARIDTIQPTVHSYSTVLNAFAKCGAAERAHSILNKVLEKRLIEPDTVMFNVVIHAWAISGDPQAGTKALQLLQQMQSLTEEYPNVRPDIVTYNSVLAAWSKSGHEDAGPQAEKILKQLQDEDSDVTPNVVSYNSVLHAWSNMSSQEEGAAAQAQAVLDYMLQQDDLEPDVYSFTSVLTAWAKSKVPAKAHKARQLLDRLLELHHPDHHPISAIPFNVVLNACAFSSVEESKPALQIAVSTFKQIRQYTNPDTITYGNLLKCCTNLVPQGKTRTDMALHIFHKCCEDGLVGDLVWNQVRRAVPSQELSQDLDLNSKSVGTTSLRDLPKSWRRNTRDKQAAQRKSRRRLTEKQSDELATFAEESQPIRPMRSIVEKSYESGRDI